MSEFLFFIKENRKAGANYLITDLTAKAVRDEKGRYQILEDLGAYMGKNEEREISFCECQWNNDFSGISYTSRECLHDYEKVSMEVFLKIREEIMSMSDTIIEQYQKTANSAKFFIQQDNDFMDMVRRRLVSVQGEENTKYGVFITLCDFYHTKKGEESSFRVSFVGVNTFEEGFNFYTEDNPVLIEKEEYLQNVKQAYSKSREIDFPNYSKK